MLRYKISALDHGRRAESFLQNLMPAAPLSYLRKVINAGNVTTNGIPSSPETVLRLSDDVEIKETAKTKSFLSNRPCAPDILLEDKNIIIFNKPSRMPVHRTAENSGEDLIELAMKYLESRDNRAVKLYPINRLDKGTSGAVMTAKSSVLAGHYGKLYQEGLVQKRYLVFVLGKMQNEGLIDLPLDGKEAVTPFQTLFRGQMVSLLSVRPLTGRTHQIRRHLAALRHPLIGDKRYGGKNVQGFNNDALHALMLSFRDPFSGQERTIYAPVTLQFLKNLENLTGESAHSIIHSFMDN